MSRVFVARDAALGRDVVVKVLAPELAAGARRPSGSRARSGSPRRCRSRTSCPCSPPGTTTDGLPYYTMPFVAGESLRARLDRRPDLPVAEAVERPARRRDRARVRARAGHRAPRHQAREHPALRAHRRRHGLRHRQGARGVEDARARRRRSRRPARRSARRRTWRPSRRSATTVDARADLYAWGVMAYELLAGRPPFGQDVGAGAHRRARRWTAGAARRAAPAAPARSSRRRDALPGEGSGAQAGGARGDHRGARRRPPPAAPAQRVTPPTRGRRERRRRRAPLRESERDLENEFFSDGITDEILNTLAPLEGLRVAARTSCFALKGQNLDLRTRRRRLDVTLRARRQRAHARANACACRRSS